VLFAARIAFGIFFLGSAVLKLLATDVLAGMLAGAGFATPLPFVYLAAACQAAAGIALLANRFVVSACLGLVAYVALVNVFLHPFWALEGEAASIQFQLFSKNAGIIAGLLAVAGGYRRQTESDL
jgi:putative oxidoreductase